MDSRNFQTPLSALDKIASQPHTITPSGRPGISYRDDRLVVSAGSGVLAGKGSLVGPPPPPPGPLGAPLMHEPSPELQGQGIPTPPRDTRQPSRPWGPLPLTSTHTQGGSFHSLVSSQQYHLKARTKERGLTQKSERAGFQPRFCIGGYWDSWPLRIFYF